MLVCGFKNSPIVIVFPIMHLKVVTPNTDQEPNTSAAVWWPLCPGLAVCGRMFSSVAGRHGFEQWCGVNTPCRRGREDAI